MRNLWECTRVRQSLLSKRIYLLVTSCDQNPSVTKKETKDLKGNTHEDAFFLFTVTEIISCYYNF